MSETDSQSGSHAETTESARSVLAYFNNQTSFTLTLQSASLQGGEWVTKPPGTIAAGTKGKWQSDSDGFMTGTEGTCIYHLNDGQTTECKLHWDNPYTGSNSYRIEVSTETFKGTYDGGSGDNAMVNYYVSKVS